MRTDEEGTRLDFRPYNYIIQEDTSTTTLMYDQF